jgi:hypothetical protein
LNDVIEGLPSVTGQGNDRVSPYKILWFCILFTTGGSNKISKDKIRYKNHILSIKQAFA